MSSRRTMKQVLALALAASTLAGCGGDSKPPSAGNTGGSGGSSNIFGEEDASVSADGAVLGKDTTGPEITIESPEAGDIVGGDEVQIIAKIVDEQSGVDAESIRFVVRVEKQDKTYDTVPVDKDKFGAVFYPTQEARYKGRAQITINVSAKDTKGNINRGETTVRLDTVRPFVSLDPANVTALTKASGGSLICSEEFDPLGQAASDGDIKTRAALLRMFVYERGVSLGPEFPTYLSLINPEEVRTYVQDQTDVPLLLDANKDGTCDTLNLKPGSADQEPLLLKFAPITPTGKAVDSTGSNDELGCEGAAKASTPARLCMGESDMTIAVPDGTEGAKTPAVYVFLAKAGIDCTGAPWEKTSTLGWVCMVGAATDNAGNLGFSAPMRVCFSNDDTCPDGEPPSCTDGCKMPDDQKRDLIKGIEVN